MEGIFQIQNIPESRIFSVSKLSECIKQRLERDSGLKEVWVRGEISNYVLRPNGNIYFTLKDESSQIRCAMFNNSVGLKFELEHGMKVLVLSSVKVYKKNGNYELIVFEMHPDGLGVLHQRFLQLKEKLEKEGLFANELKKPIPKFPRTIGIITSPTGAAIEDLLINLTRRFPVNIKHRPTLVQGYGAAEDIVKAIEALNKIKEIDVIILGRGGGSLEDLWCFNEEIVARAIFNSKIPIISAVGHETDFTIADFVADYRTPTPSTAAEIAVPDKNELMKSIGYLKDKIIAIVERIIELKMQHLAFIRSRAVFVSPADFINQNIQQVDELSLRTDNAILNFIELKGKSFEVLYSSFHSLNPEAVLSRGFSIAMSEGKIIKTVEDVKIGEIIEIIIHNGKIKSRVMEKNDRQ